MRCVAAAEPAKAIAWVKPYERMQAMLVLSRRAHQQIVFPNLGVRLSVLQVKGRLVKIGIDAPDSIKVLREELSSESANGSPPEEEISPSEEQRKLDHQRRNELNLLQLQLESIQRKIDRGELVDPQAASDALLNKFSSIDHEMVDDNKRKLAPMNQGRPVRLLVVEDSDNERKLMAYLLADCGFDVQVARDGLEALEQLHLPRYRPDFILMDMQMPNSDGLQTLMQIRADEELQRLKVFAVTGMARDVQNEPVAHGWDGWFQKPLDVSALISRLRADSPHLAPELAH